MIGETQIRPQSAVLSHENLKINSSSRSNPNVSIEFSLSHSDWVSVKIYNLSGREITTLVNKNLDAGSHSISWNTRNLATGCYTVRMQAETNTFVKSIPIF
jgi:flagellar hook assembly protein FlgD